MIMVIYMKKLIGRVAKFVGYRSKKQWKDIEYFNPQWKERISQMSQFIDSGESVTDLGCGQMWLKEDLDKTSKYIPVDYISRGEGTIICDFNNKEYPKIRSDIAFSSGCLEYIKDYDWFISQISDYHDKCILSYCTVESFPNVDERRQKTWVNDLSDVDIIELFKKNGFELKEKIPQLNTIFVFEK